MERIGENKGNLLDSRLEVHCQAGIPRRVERDSYCQIKGKKMRGKKDKKVKEGRGD